MNRLRHDLGKYICFEIRWLEEGAGPAQVREALRSDLLRTRRSPEGVEDVAAVWARLRTEVPAEHAAWIDAAVAELHARALRLDEMDDAALAETVAMTRAFADRLRAETNPATKR